MTLRQKHWRGSVLAKINAIQELRTNAGPGIRTEVFWHGCSRGCPGCINDWTKDYPYREVSGRTICEEIIRLGNPHVSLSGGEPLEQHQALSTFLYNSYRFKNIREDERGTLLIFTGYELDEIIQMPVYYTIRMNVDYLVTGPYVEELRYDIVPDTTVGSSNQHFYTRNRGVWVTPGAKWAPKSEWQEQPLDEHGRWIQGEQLS
jgi:anaerobic ribonucleoside-triphosphate reductase activating protein